jgi:N-methylhydantoinase A/oxoprolinase/acetone carboxylase beta subunit
MSVFLGIDTGGTYTDAALLDDEHGVISTAKALTTKHDLSVGIQNAVQMALLHPPPDIQLVSLSSTLATNAIVEGKGSPICLLLIGYEPQLLENMGFEKLVANKHIVFIQGGHTVEGEEKCPLDIKAARQAILDQTPYVSGFAISGFFGVYNPTHELRVRRLVHNLTDLPVTCGHELTTQLDAPLRALTVTLNARLIPLMQQLILKVREFLGTQGIRAPLMIVKGDGSLMDASVALKRPVEIIMSGPAASVVGGLHLCKEKDGLVIDMGGTTTDVAMVYNGYPVLNPKGARVGGWQTMVETMDVHTTGLGGDSEVRLDESGNLIVGPRRVVPLSLLAADYPATLDTLHLQLGRDLDTEAGRFVMRERSIGADWNNLSSNQQRIWELLVDGPVSFTQLFDGVEIPRHFRYSLDGLIEQGFVAVSAFTPTDAVHVLGQYRSGSVEAATLGAEIWSQRLGTGMEEFCQKVVERVIIQAGHSVIESALAGENGISPGSQDKVGRLLINQALGIENSGSFKVTLSLRRPLIGIGAPAGTYLTPLAKRLNTQLRIPQHAEVANAIGAVAGGVVQKVHILIRQPWGEGGVYRVNLPFGVRDFQELADAADHAQKTARRLARSHALEAGAGKVKIFVERNDQIVPLVNDLLYLGTEITATAAGRPQPKEGR